MGNEGRARDSRPPPPHPPGNLFLTGKSDESRYIACLGQVVAGGGRAGRGVAGPGGGGGVRGVSREPERGGPCRPIETEVNRDSGSTYGRVSFLSYVPP